LQVDPNLAQCPDYAAPEFLELREIIKGARGFNENQALQFLVTQWTVKNDADKVAWAAQRLQPAAEQQQGGGEGKPEAANPQEEDPERSEGTPDLSEEDDNDFELGVMVPDSTPTMPCPFALERLGKKQYIELWYFTPEGRREEQTVADRPAAEEAFTLVHDGKGVELRKASSLSASKKAIKDEFLSWDQFTKATGVFLDLLPDAGWKKRTREAFTMFFYRIEKHTLREEPYGEVILLAYQARVRREWHRALAAKAAFDISVINEKRLQGIQTEVLN
ncbi:hypothetical protein OBBRIDRAFT_715766, partial [Obba rivulosa]